ncbi:hypothetical protein ACFO4E_21680 [Nocardiopsis mangrovi]|uniref:DUF58 domain-containing protein n=1 Tax=Nocardiopsis mangrovi TaxID=1179818 RepID=A0ABV9E006_9ACTN
MQGEAQRLRTIADGTRRRAAHPAEPPRGAAPVEAEQQTWALVDAPAAMDFGAATMPKRDLATSVVSTVALLAERSRHPVGVRIAYGRMLGTVPAKDGPAPMTSTLRTLLGLPAPARWDVPGVDLAEALDRLHSEHPGPGPRIIAAAFPCGEGGTGPLPWEAPLRRLALRHDVTAVEIPDPRDLDLPDVGVIALVDPATGARREIATSDPLLRDRHAAAATERGRRRLAAFHAAGVTHIRLGAAHAPTHDVPARRRPWTVPGTRASSASGWDR